MERLNELIAERVKNCRKELGMTQEKLAEESGYSVQHISSIENGKRKMSYETAMTFSNIFHIDYKYFLGEEPYKNKNEKAEFNGTLIERLDNTFKQLLYFLGFRISDVVFPKKDCKNIYDDACVVIEDYNDELSYYHISYRDYLEIRKDILTYAQYRFSKLTIKEEPGDLSHLNIEQISKNMALLVNEENLGLGWDAFEFLSDLERADIEAGINYSKIVKKAMKE